MPIYNTCTVCGDVSIKQVKGLCRSCYTKKRRVENPALYRGYAISFNTKHPGRAVIVQRKYQDAHREEINRTANTKNRLLKLEVVSGYGGKCECCGESNPVFLTIDHIYNDGQADRKSDHSGWRFYLRLKKLGFPKDRYRLLCYNCNLARGFWGICPHEEKRNLVGGLDNQTRV